MVIVFLQKGNLSLPLSLTSPGLRWEDLSPEKLSWICKYSTVIWEYLTTLYNMTRASDGIKHWNTPLTFHGETQHI